MVYDFSLGASRDLSKSDERRLLRGASQLIQHTVFGHDWNLVILDEAHILRTGGKGFYGMVKLRKNAMACILSTATPLYTSPRVRTITSRPLLLVQR